MDPEVLECEEYSKASDVYSFGMIVYEIFMGERPFPNMNFYQFYRKICREFYRPPIGDFVPYVYSELIFHCWSQMPSDRPSFDDIVYELKNNTDFITDNVDEQEFLDYIDFIDSYISTFDAHNAIDFSDFIKFQNKKEIDTIQIKKHKKRKSKSHHHHHHHHKKQKSSSKELVEPLDINQYQVQKKIDEGAFGEVLKVKDKTTGKIYAAKVSKKSFGGDENEEEEESQELLNIDLQREINNSFKFKHPAIVEFIGFSLIDFSGKKRPVLILEFVSGGSLKNVMAKIRKGRADLKWNDTKKLIIIYGIASAMDYLHSNNIIHRDLKPDNILMDDDLNPKIADFGLSKTLHTNKESLSVSTTGIKGTPLYIPFETYNDEKSTKQGDVYAFAMIVYEIMTHDIPFGKCNFNILCTLLLNKKRPSFNAPIPESYKKLIESCWSQDPSLRPTFSEIVDKLKNDKEFITDTIDEALFLKYVDYIADYPVSFKKNKFIPSFKDFNHIKTPEKIVEVENTDEKSSEEKNAEILKDDVEANIPENDDAIDANPPDDISYKDANELFETWLNLFYGKDVPIDKKASLSYIKLAAEKGHIIASFIYASMLNNGCGVAANPKEASIYFKKAADEDHIESMHIYASMKSKGIGVPIDKKEALEYFKKAADKGHLDSMYEYAMMKLSVPEEAAFYLQKAADGGHVESMFSYANLLCKNKVKTSL